MGACAPRVRARLARAQRALHFEVPHLEHIDFEVHLERLRQVEAEAEWRRDTDAWIAELRTARRALVSHPIGWTPETAARVHAAESALNALYEAHLGCPRPPGSLRGC